MSDTATGTPAETPGAPEGEPHGAEETTETPTIEDLLAKVDEITKESRKWEGRAKANKDAADRLAEIEREKMTDAERAEADRTAAAEHLATVEKERDDAVAALARYKVATEFGLDADDAEALASVTDEAALRALAERLAGRSSTGPKPNPAQGRTKKAPVTPGEAFADALGDLFN